MNISIFNRKDFETKEWSGGTTTQLYISPANASYIERNFNVRISTAKVEAEESSFTPLPGVNRKLMILDGEIEITHENQYSKHLKSFDVDAFSGDWKTSSVGTCTDFNVMTSGQMQSELFALHLKAEASSELKYKKEYSMLCLYLLSGRVSIEINKAKLHLSESDLLILEDANSCLFPLHAYEDSQLVVTQIK